jgi:hypothetical protein
MSIAKNPQNGKATSANKQMFRPQAHPYTVQIDAKIRPLHIAVTPGFYLVTIGSHSIGLGLAGDRIRVIVDNNRVQKFSRAALADSDRILDYLGLADDPHSRCFERMCADFAEAHAIDASGATERKAEELRTFETVPGDGGCSDQDLEAPLPAATYRLNLQSFIAGQDWPAVDETIERMRAQFSRLNERQAREYQSVIDWALNLKPATNGNGASAAGIAADIQRMLGPGEPVAEWKPTKADKARAAAQAIKNQPRQTGIGSMPAAWRHR